MVISFVHKFYLWEFRQKQTKLHTIQLSYILSILWSKISNLLCKRIRVFQCWSQGIMCSLGTSYKWQRTGEWAVSSTGASQQSCDHSSHVYLLNLSLIQPELNTKNSAMKAFLQKFLPLLTVKHVKFHGLQNAFTYS